MCTENINRDQRFVYQRSPTFPHGLGTDRYALGWFEQTESTLSDLDVLGTKAIDDTKVRLLRMFR